MNAIDLRSDTVTRPSPGMRRAMAEAEVGDDTLDGDPTTLRLEHRMAELFGTEAALFFPSGTQSNQTAIWVITQPGTELVLEANAHIVHYEIAGAAALSGVQIRPVSTADGILTAELVAPALRPASPHTPEVSAVAAENTHNAAGGKIFPLAAWDELVALTSDRGLPLHLVGSCLMSSGELIDRARRVRRRLGGAMRQTGVLAAAGLYALDHNLHRLSDDHAHATRFADRLRNHPAVKPNTPETNIVMLDLTGPGLTADVVLPKLADAGVLLVPFGPTRLRAVTHLDVTAEQVETAADIVARVLDQRGD
jgi:threonine aldolase